MSVGLFGVDVGELGVEDKVVPVRAECGRDPPPKKRVREDGTVLCQMESRLASLLVAPTPTPRALGARPPRV